MRELAPSAFLHPDTETLALLGFHTFWLSDCWGLNLVSLIDLCCMCICVFELCVVWCVCVCVCEFIPGVLLGKARCETAGR